MNTTWRLARTILRGNRVFNITGDANGRPNRWRAFGGILTFTLLVLYVMGVSGFGAWELVGLLARSGQAGLIVGMTLNSGATAVLIFGFMSTLSVFYYASDVDRLLPLPLRPEQVIGAKFIVALVYNLLLIAGYMLPPLLIYGIRLGSPLLYFIVLIPSILLIPIQPLAMATILVMLVMRFTPLARNKDRFKIISSLLLMGAMIALSSGLTAVSAQKPDQIANMLSKSASTTSQIGGQAIPGLRFAIQALAQADQNQIGAVIQLLVFGLACLVLVTVMLTVGRLLYYRGLIGLSAAAGQKRRLSARELGAGRGSSGWQSAIFAYSLKDLRVLFRTPIYLLNNVLFNFIWPLMLILPMIGAGQSDPDFQQIMRLLDQLSADPTGPATPIALGVVFGLAVFVNGTNGIAESALSREGRQFYLMKILPMSYPRQIAAKLAAGVAMGIAGLAFSFSLTFILLDIPLWFAGLAILTFPGAILLPNLSGIIFELYWPKLNWDSEQKAVKQNMNVLYGILVSAVLAGLAIVPVVVLHLNLATAVVVLIAAPLGLSVALAFLVRSLTDRRMRSIDV